MIGVGVPQITAHGFDDPLRRLRAAGTIEENRGPIAHAAGEGRELATAVVDGGQRKLHGRQSTTPSLLKQLLASGTACGVQRIGCMAKAKKKLKRPAKHRASWKGNLS